jgi:SAM-dependent methyltransferase
MSHREQLGFFAAVAEANQGFLEGGRVLEVGSYDVNGTVRGFFPGATEYVGVDLVDGPGVDVVGYGHELDFPDGHFDAALSAECFEHDPHWRSTFGNMVRMTRQGGLVAFTCASRGRPEHGTTRTGVGGSPGTQAVGLDYYQNLTTDDFSGLPLDDMFTSYRFWYMRTHFDLFFAGIRPGGVGASLPGSASVESLASLMPIGHRLSRLPLRIALKVSPVHYQSFAIPYWLTMGRLEDLIRRS